MTEHMQLGSIEIRQPRPIVLEALRYVHSGKALDLGAGFGRHSLFLATKGFAVTSLETDSERLQSLCAKASQLGARIDARGVDIRDPHSYEGQYDLILSTMTLHFLANQEEFDTAVHRMQEATAPGGVNVICAYTDKSEPGLRPFLVNAEELKQTYAGWEILRFDELPGTDAASDGPDHDKKITRVEMIARKKESRE